MLINSFSNIINSFSARTAGSNCTVRTGGVFFAGNNNTAPLACDTVSFTGKGKLKGEYMAFAPSEELCHRVEENAQPARYYLECILDKYIQPRFEQNNGKNPPVTYYTRVKNAKSIREKVISRYMKWYNDDVSALSSQIADEFCRFYKISDNYNKTVIKNVINKYILSLNNPSDKISPYNSVEYFVCKAAERIKKFNMMNINSYLQYEQDLKNSRIIEAIQDSDNAAKSLNRMNMKVQSISGIKYYANDIAGARIILHDCNSKTVNSLFDGLKQAVEDKKLKILSIENNIPDPDKLPKNKKASDYAYVKNSTLKKLAELSGAEYKVNKSKSGYLSVHINVDLSNDILKKYRGMYNGYLGEIQILGADVEKLKDVEDLCYKFKDDKYSVDEVYQPFKDVFLTYYTGKTKKAFDDYTYALYLHQREIEPDNSNYTLFPSIEKLGFKGKVPPELDFNNLAAIKQKCDIYFDCKNDATDKAMPANGKKSVKEDENIDKLIKLIAYDIKYRNNLSF